MVPIEHIGGAYNTPHFILFSIHTNTLLIVHDPQRIFIINAPRCGMYSRIVIIRRWWTTVSRDEYKKGWAKVAKGHDMTEEYARDDHLPAHIRNNIRIKIILRAVDLMKEVGQVTKCILYLYLHI